MMLSSIEGLHCLNIPTLRMLVLCHPLGAMYLTCRYRRVAVGFGDMAVLHMQPGKCGP
jgi:hypothetical protein